MESEPSQASLSNAVIETPVKSHKSKSHGERKRKREHGDDAERRRSKKTRKDSTNKTRLGTEVTTDSNLPFQIQTSSFYLPLSPISQRQPLEGICAEHLSPLILTYYPPLGGVVISYHNVRLSEQPFGDDGNSILFQCIDEYAATFAWVTADFLIFKPRRSGHLEGYVNLQNEDHLGLVCWNLFNASIERHRLPKDWQWVSNATAELQGDLRHRADGVGYYKDQNGDRIAGLVKFRVKSVESSHDRERGFLSIEGTMLDESDEQELLEREIVIARHMQGPGRMKGGSKALGATSLGAPRTSVRD
jgi:DNA-directed RNA polymerase I subunit RPA43